MKRFEIQERINGEWKTQEIVEADSAKDALVKLLVSRYDEAELEKFSDGTIAYWVKEAHEDPWKMIRAVEVNN